MKYPDLSSLPRTPHIVDGMIADIAYHELDTAESYQHPEDKYSRELGALCVSLQTGATVTVESTPQRASGVAIENTNLEQLVLLAVHRKDGNMQLQLQRRLHQSTIATLREAMRSSGPERKWGRIVELTCQALLTRYAHPNLLAYPALPHHERNRDIAGHYDAGVVIKNPDESTSSHYLQVKSFCLGRCDQTKAAQDAAQVRAKYRPIVQFVSGCCDLDTGSHGQTRAEYATVPGLLLKERRGDATASEIKRLDNLSDGLIFNMSSDLLLRGTNSGNNTLRTDLRQLIR